jgi:hypothetical protein
LAPSLLEVDQSEERAVVEAHGELLEPLATTILKEWAEEELAAGKTDFANFLTAYRAMLTQCRMKGVGGAFEQRARAPLESPNPELARLQLNLGDLIARAQQDAEAAREFLFSHRLGAVGPKFNDINQDTPDGPQVTAKFGPI